eukprot:131174-Chlamydomonas_euryale.AAC.1
MVIRGLRMELGPERLECTLWTRTSVAYGLLERGSLRGGGRGGAGQGVRCGGANTAEGGGKRERERERERERAGGLERGSLCGSGQGGAAAVRNSMRAAA